MKTFDADQQTLADATFKTVSWFFEVTNTYIDYDNKPSDAKFTVGNSLYGATSGATATIEKHERFTQSTGRLHLSGILGTFQDDEIIYESALSSEYITDSDNQDFSDGTINEWIVDYDGSSGVCEYEGIDPSGEKVMEIRDTSGDGTYIIGILGTNNLTAFAENDFIKFSAATYLESGNTCDDIVMDLAAIDATNPITHSNQTKEQWNTLNSYFRITGSDVTGTINIGLLNPSNGDILYVDDISVKKITNAALCNGGQQGDLYYWSTKGYEYGEITFGSGPSATPLTFGSTEIVFGNDYVYKVIKDSFDGIELSAPLNQYETYAPNILEFAIDNSDESLTASDFENCRVLCSLAMESDNTRVVMRQWKFVVERADPIYKTIEFYCKDFVASAMDGDYPNTPLASDLFSPLSTDSSLTDSEPFCVPVPFGTCYIPLKVVPDSAYNKGYLLGPDDYTYTISEVSSPRYFDAAQTWTSSDADFRRDTKSDRFTPSQDWKILYPYLAKMDSNSYSGTHTGSNNASTLSDSTKSWIADELIGLRIVNDTDNSSGYITDNDSTTITVSLSGGTDNDFDTNDEYHIEATGLWVVNGEFQNLLVKFTRSDLSSTTDVSDHLAYVLEDFGIGAGNIDTATSFVSAQTDYTSWGLTFNGAYYYKQPRPSVVSSILNQSHSTIDIDTKVELRTLSKTSVKTIDDSDILKKSFNHSYVTKSEYDSGQIAFQETGKPQDIFQKLTVPAKNTWDNPSSEVLELPFIQDSQVAQAIGMLYYQRQYLREADETFDTKSTCLALQPNDIITINNSNYGPSHDVLIESMHIHRDASISFSCIRFSLSLDDFDDLSPNAVSIMTDENSTYWQSVICGPDSATPDSGDIPHVIPGLLRIGASGDYILIDPTLKRISSSNYVSGVTGAGFLLDSDLLEVGNIACRGIFRSAVFQYDNISAHAGSHITAMGADVLATDMTALDSSTLEIENDSGASAWNAGDKLQIKDSSDNEYFTIVSNSGNVYTVTRDIKGDYGADSNPTWKKGVAVINWGQSGDGAVYVTASDTNAPYISILTHAGEPWNATTRGRHGNLNGYLGVSSDKYGFGAGSGNDYVLINDVDGVLISLASGSGITLKIGADITLESTSGNTSDLNFICDSRTYTLQGSFDNDSLCITSDTDGQGRIAIGYDIDLSTHKRPNLMSIDLGTSLSVATGSGNDYSSYFFGATSGFLKSYALGSNTKTVIDWDCGSNAEIDIYAWYDNGTDYQARMTMTATSTGSDIEFRADTIDVTAADGSPTVQLFPVTSSALKATYVENSVLLSAGASGNVSIADSEYGLFGIKLKQSSSGAVLAFTQWINDDIGTSYEYLDMRFTETGEYYATYAYVWQKYIQSSGEIFWYMAMRNKETKEVLREYAAPDHPAYHSHSNDPEKTPIPVSWKDFNPDIHEVIITNLNNEQLEAIDKLVSFDENKRSRLSVLNEMFEWDESEEEKWHNEPITIGLESEWKRKQRKHVKTEVAIIKKQPYMKKYRLKPKEIK